jgi:hypothetical protein
MTSIRSVDGILPYSPRRDRATTISSLIRFNSARIEPERTENRTTSPPGTPFDIQIDDSVFPSSPTPNRIHSTSRITSLATENDGGRVVKISEYHAPKNTPFEPITSNISPKKLHHYLLLEPRTIFSISLLTILSLAIVLIGFGVAVSYRQAQFNYRCPSISYCPRNSSYTLLCNITNEFCSCYNNENTLIGCLQQRQYGEGCYRSQECSIHHNLQCNMNIYQCQCLDHYLYNGSLCIPMLTYNDTCSIFNFGMENTVNHIVWLIVHVIRIKFHPVVR